VERCPFFFFFFLLPLPCFLGRSNGELVEDLAGVAAERPEERSVPIHHNEPKLVVRLQELVQGLRVELVVAEVPGTR